jgi:hypothetical protein
MRAVAHRQRAAEHPSKAAIDALEKKKADKESRKSKIGF